jgi:hypothetical protein
MNYRKALLGAALVLAAWENPLALSQQEKEAPVKETQPVLKENAAAFFWFNSRVIANAGNSMYGRFAYDTLLPWLAPAKQVAPNVWFVLFDGDCMTGMAPLKSYFRPQDGPLLEEAIRLGEHLCYVVAVMGQGTRTWEQVDRDLREAKTLGYMGVTIPAKFDRETYLRCCKTMALVPAARIDGAKFKRIDYGYHADGELKRMGFEPGSEQE